VHNPGRLDADTLPRVVEEVKKSKVDVTKKVEVKTREV
jgi:hypothetical protein